MQKTQPTWLFIPAFTILGLLGTLPVVNGIYDIHLEHFGLSNPNGKFFGNYYSLKRLNAFLKSRDHATADFSLDGAEELNSRVPIRPELSYFSYPCVITQPRATALGGRELPPLKELKDPVLQFYSVQMGLGWGFAKVKRTHADGTETPDPEWLQNDGAVPLASGRYPFGQPHQEFDAKAPLEPGVWNVMPTKYGVDHGYYCGWDVNHNNFEELTAFYLQHFALLEKTITGGRSQGAGDRALQAAGVR
jgi:triacylglycerol lipase